MLSNLSDFVKMFIFVTDSGISDKSVVLGYSFTRGLNLCDLLKELVFPEYFQPIPRVWVGSWKAFLF